MKIGFLTPLRLSAFQEYFPNSELPRGYTSDIFIPLIRQYLSEGHEVIVCTQNPDSTKSQVFKADRLTIFVAGTLKIPKIRALTYFNKEISEMSQFLKENPCDVYHAQWSYEFAAAALRVDPERTIITIHDWPERIYSILHDFYRKKRLELSERIFRDGLYFTAVSPYIKEQFEEKYADKSIKVIPNYIELDDERMSVLDSKSPNLESPTIVSINTFDKRKNTTSLIEAFSYIRAEIPNARLKLIGSGHGMNEGAYKWAVERGLESGIEFIGRIPHDDVLDNLEQADLLIHASLEESFGLTLIEAMASNTPVIAGEKSGAVPWVLDGGKAGRLVDVTDPVAISNDAIELLSSEELWCEYVKRGKERVNDFRFENIYSMYLNEYSRIIEKQK